MSRLTPSEFKVGNPAYDSNGNMVQILQVSELQETLSYIPVGDTKPVATSFRIMRDRFRVYGDPCVPLPVPAEPAPATDAVKSPSHYQFFPDLEAIEIIAASLTAAEFRGYCLGNRLKYRLRAGNKDKLEQDIAKSDFYIKLYEQHKHLCKD